MIVKLNHTTAAKLQALPVGSKFTLSIKDGKRRRLKAARLTSRSAEWCPIYGALYIKAEVSTASGPLFLMA
jgi:hypothetical protein